MSDNEIREGLMAGFSTMPDSIFFMAQLGFHSQNRGRLSKRAREEEFAELTADEVTQIAELHGATFGAS